MVKRRKRKKNDAGIEFTSISCKITSAWGKGQRPPGRRKAGLTTYYYTRDLDILRVGSYHGRKGCLVTLSLYFMEGVIELSSPLSL
jgi:hypothetical protein